MTQRQSIIPDVHHVAQSRTSKVLALSAGQALTTLVGLMSVAVLTRVLSKTDFGSYRQAILAYSFAAPFAVLGLDRTLYAFLPGETRRPRALLVENLLLLTTTGGILSLFIAVGGRQLLAHRFNNPALAHLLLLMVPYPLFMVPALATAACLMSRDQAGRVALYNVSSRLIMFVLAVVPCLFWPSPSTAVLGQVAGAVLTTIVAVYLMFEACPGPIWRPTWVGLKKQFCFSVPLGLSAIVATMSVTLDQVLVSLRCSPEVFAVYTVGAMEIPLIGIITGSMTSVVLVDYARFYREGNPQAVVDLIHKVMTKSGTVILPTMAILFCIAPELMRVFFGKGYGWSAIPFRIYLLQLPIRTITFGAILLATGHSRSILGQSLLGLTANVALAWTLLGVLGATGAALGSVLATYLVSIPYLTLVICRVLKTRPWDLFPWLDLGKLTAISIIPAAVILPLKLVLHMSDYAWLVFAVAVCVPFWAMGFEITGTVNIRRELALFAGAFKFN